MYLTPHDPLWIADAGQSCSLSFPLQVLPAYPF